MKLWRCPNCQTGRRAPATMRKRDARRYCLTCTATTGFLVDMARVDAQRRAETRERQRVAVKTRRATQKAVARVAELARLERLAKVITRERADAVDWLKAWAPKVLNLKTWDRFAAFYPNDSGWCGAGRITIQYRLGRKKFYSTGRAWPYQQRLVVTTGADAYEDLSTLLHEIAHLVAPRGAHHDQRFREIEIAAVCELTGEDLPLHTRRGEDHRRRRDEAVKKWLDSQLPS